MVTFFGSVIGITLLLLGTCLIFWSLHCFIEGQSWLFRVTSLLVTISFWAGIFTGMEYLSNEAGKKGPCVEYETQMHYNPALKMMMPAKVCTKRGNG